MRLPNAQKRILTIDRDCDPVEQSALVMAVMAFPGRGEEEQRMHAFEALVARPIHEFRRTMRDNTAFADPRWEAFLELKSEPEAVLLCRKIWKIVSARSEVGEIAEPWIQELSAGTTPILPSLTDSVLKDRVSERTKRSPENWLRRTWRPAKPAFHLYAAYQIAHRELPPHLQDPFDPRSKDTRAPNTDLTRNIIKTAMDLQTKLIADPRLPFGEADLILLDGDIAENCDEPLKSAPALIDH